MLLFYDCAETLTFQLHAKFTYARLKILEDLDPLAVESLAFSAKAMSAVSFDGLGVGGSARKLTCFPAQ